MPEHRRRGHEAREVYITALSKVKVQVPIFAVVSRS
jgi:hypothetical protein